MRFQVIEIFQGLVETPDYLLPSNKLHRIFSAKAFINNGGTQLPICRIPSSNSPANVNASGNELNLFNSGNENLRFSFQCIAPCIPRFPSLRLIVRAGFLGSNFTALNPWPVIGFSDDPRRILLQPLIARAVSTDSGDGTGV